MLQTQLSICLYCLYGYTKSQVLLHAAAAQGTLTQLCCGYRQSVVQRSHSIWVRNISCHVFQVCLCYLRELCIALMLRATQSAMTVLKSCNEPVLYRPELCGSELDSPRCICLPADAIPSKTQKKASQNASHGKTTYLHQDVVRCPASDQCIGSDTS